MTTITAQTTDGAIPDEAITMHVNMVSFSYDVTHTSALLP